MVHSGQSLGYLNKLLSLVVNDKKNQPAFGPEAGLVLILCPHHLILLVQTPDLSFPVEFL